MKTTDLQTTHF